MSCLSVCKCNVKWRLIWLDWFLYHLKIFQIKSVSGCKSSEEHIVNYMTFFSFIYLKRSQKENGWEAALVDMIFSNWAFQPSKKMDCWLPCCRCTLSPCCLLLGTMPKLVGNRVKHAVFWKKKLFRSFNAGNHLISSKTGAAAASALFLLAGAIVHHLHELFFLFTAWNFCHISTSPYLSKELIGCPWWMTHYWK